MIERTASEQGVPFVELEVFARRFVAIIDTGFNGDLELPASLQPGLLGRYVGRVTSSLAAGQIIEEDLYLVEFPFDGQTMRAEASFVSGAEMLVGTRLLKHHRLEIDFARKKLSISRTAM